jgi:hypothetical protein
VLDSEQKNITGTREDQAVNPLPFVPDDWPDDEEWEVFLPDGDPYEPEPAPGDFWIGDEPDELLRLAA